MSKDLLKLALAFTNDELSGKEFVNRYQSLWKEERDKSLLQHDNDKLSELLSTFFCLADLFNPETDKENYELDETTLKKKIHHLLENAPDQYD